MTTSSLAIAQQTTTIGTAADAALEKGKAIALEAERRDSGFIDSESTIKMTLRDKKGRERVRTLRIKSMERPNDGDWSLTIFDEPADVEGTALLTY
ncbi:MAG: outer membrane lipoprotein-sorting protein, partial [Pseudomonadales bacterium]|nr:outer membrane lipoprotein-sorting protein [Pseudomonadales bacterium]